MGLGAVRVELEEPVESTPCRSVAAALDKKRPENRERSNRLRFGCQSALHLGNRGGRAPDGTKRRRQADQNPGIVRLELIGHAECPDGILDLARLEQGVTKVGVGFTVVGPMAYRRTKTGDGIVVARTGVKRVGEAEMRRRVGGADFEQAAETILCFRRLVAVEQ